MNYFEFFPFLSLGWGTLGLAASLKGESAVRTGHQHSQRKYSQYNLLAKLWLIIGWGYLVACVPVFRDGQYVAQSMQFFYSMIAILLSLEIWAIFIGTLTAVALAKKSHDPDFSSLFVQWHLPLKRILKPMVQLVSVAHLANALYFILL